MMLKLHLVVLFSLLGKLAGRATYFTDVFVDILYNRVCN